MTTTTVTITPPKIGEARISIRGLAPYVQHKFGAKARQKLADQMMAGSQAKSRKVREPRDFSENFRDATHLSTEGWYGIPAPAFRNAMIDAMRLIGFQMTKGKMSVFVVHDGVDPDGTPLVRIEGTPHEHMAYVRNDTGVVDLRCRPMWDEWSASVHVKWDEGQFSAGDVYNLMARAGLQVGIGEGRPFSKNSAGQGWGIFEVVA